jgi:hypothetical protein
MKINNEEVNIDDLVDNKYMHKEINKGIFLSDYQIEVLMRYQIDPYKCSSINELIYLIDEVLEDEDEPDLDSVSKEIMEFNYYTNTNK